MVIERGDKLPRAVIICYKMAEIGRGEGLPRADVSCERLAEMGEGEGLPRGPAAASDISRVTIPILAVAIVACFHRILVALASSDLIDK